MMYFAFKKNKVTIKVRHHEFVAPKDRWLLTYMKYDTHIHYYLLRQKVDKLFNGKQFIYNLY